MKSTQKLVSILGVILILISCKKEYTTPKEIIDLGAVVTEDLPERVWVKH